MAPTTETADAYFWLKTPGESDGCSQTLPDGSLCARFDASCASADSLGSGPGEPAAPEAGEWYDFQMKQLARNAQLSEVVHPQALVTALSVRHAFNPFEGQTFYVNPS